MYRKNHLNVWPTALRLAFIWLTIAFCSAVSAAPPSACKATKIDGASRFKMKEAASLQVLAYECDRAAMFRGARRGAGLYMAYQLVWQAGTNKEDYYLGDVGRDSDGIVQLTVSRVDTQTVAVDEQADRGGRLYLWRYEATPYVLDYVGDEESSLCLSSKDNVIAIAYCAAQGKAKMSAPELLVEWREDEGAWRVKTPDAYRAFTNWRPAHP